MAKPGTKCGSRWAPSTAFCFSHLPWHSFLSEPLLLPFGLPEVTSYLPPLPCCSDDRHSDLCKQEKGILLYFTNKQKPQWNGGRRQTLILLFLVWRYYLGFLCQWPLPASQRLLLTFMEHSLLNGGRVLNLETSCFGCCHSHSQTSFSLPPPSIALLFALSVYTCLHGILL